MRAKVWHIDTGGVMYSRPGMPRLGDSIAFAREMSEQDVRAWWRAELKVKRLPNGWKFQPVTEKGGGT